MRPRELPAEDQSTAGACWPWSPGFNEAAGVTRGRPQSEAIRNDFHAMLQ